VVDVFENCSDEFDPEWLRVHVPGVEHGQAVENVIWGPGPLAPPAEEACGSREAAGETPSRLKTPFAKG
jgi:hypothetical protein